MSLPPLVHNRLSYAGTTIAVLALSAMVFLSILNTVAGGGEAPYAGLVIFVLLPAFLIFGLALIPIGMLGERRHLRRTGSASIPSFPVIDLNDARQRNAALIFAIGSVALLFLTVFGSFEAYQATESTAFCGATCHTVMEPEKVAHEDSPHARVGCVECHVGPGADWYVKSKVAGANQLYGVLTDTYPRPIPVPIKQLRPARDTCERCHWAEQHNAGVRLRRRIHYVPDQANTPWEIALLVKMGGGRADDRTGVQWHLDATHRVEYIATDSQRQKIPWMRVTDLRSGTSTEYQSTDSPPSKEAMAAAEVRVMDCLDCHNRPSHWFRAPGESLDAALQSGEIDASLPSIKQTGVELLKAEYASSNQAQEAIANGVQQFYRENYPDLLDGRTADVARAVTALQHIYRRNFFPAMKVRWDAYPTNASHVMFAGCFRCHDGLHENSAGETVTASCTACHAITSQGKPGEVESSTEPDGLPFQHPPVPDLGDAWQDTPCTDCHAES